MKNTLLFVLLITTITGFTQTTLEIPRELEEGIQKGEASIVSKYFNDNLEVSIDGKDKIYSAKQAEYVLQRFFRAHTPKSFYITHQGGKPKTSYIIGELKTNNGNYKMILLLKKKNNTVKIHQLRIENE